MVRKTASAVGVKELKDRASELLSRVEKTGQTITITKNSREIAKIIPIRTQKTRLEDLDFLASQARGALADLELLPVGDGRTDASEAIRAILSDRSEKF